MQVLGGSFHSFSGGFSEGYLGQPDEQDFRRISAEKFTGGGRDRVRQASCEVRISSEVENRRGWNPDESFPQEDRTTRVPSRARARARLFVRFG